MQRLAAGAAEARDDDDPGRGGQRQSRPATARRAAVAAGDGLANTRDKPTTDEARLVRTRSGGGKWVGPTVG